MPTSSTQREKASGPKPGRATRWLRGVCAAVCLLFAAVCFFQAVPPGASSPNDSTAPPAAAVPTDSESQYATSNIEDLKNGDFVLAMEPSTGEVRKRRIVDVFNRTTYHLRVLEFGESDRETQRLETTDEHPFWVVSEGNFIPAGKLKKGDEFLGPNAELQTLLSTTREEHPEGITVYNFEVEGAHTYFVAAHGLRAPPVLVHNAVARSCVIGQTPKKRVHPSARALDADSLNLRSWSWEKNRQWLWNRMRQARLGKSKIYDIGGQRGKYQGPRSTYSREKALLERNGFMRVFTGRTITADNGHRFRLYEWVPRTSHG